MTTTRGSLTRTMLTILAMVVILPIALLAFSVYTRTKLILREQITNEFRSEVEFDAKEAEQIVKEKNARLADLARRSVLRENATSLFGATPGANPYRTAILKEFQTINKSGSAAKFDDIILIDRKGKIFASSQNIWEGKSIANDAIMSGLEETSHSSAIFNLDNVFTEQFVIITTVPVTNLANQPIGYLIALTTKENASAFFTKISTHNQSAQILLITRNGIFLQIAPDKNHPDTKILATYEPSPEQEILVSRLPQGDMSDVSAFNKTIEYKDYADVPWLAQPYWMPFMDVGLVVQIPQETAYSSLGDVSNIIILLAVLSILVAIVIISITTRRITRPLIQLSEAAQQFSEGKWDTRVDIKRKDEIGLIANSFNHMAEELGGMYRSLEEKIDERAEQLRAAAEISQNIPATASQEEILQQTVNSIAERFGYHHVSAFLVDRTGRNAVLTTGSLADGQNATVRDLKIEVGSDTLIGWVTANNQPKVVADLLGEPQDSNNDFIDESRSVVSVPISSGNIMRGALEVQSRQPNAFDGAAITILQTIGNQIAATLQNATLVDSTQINIQELERLYRASHQITNAKSRNDLLDVIGRVMRFAPYVNAVVDTGSKQISFISFSEAGTENPLPEPIPNSSLDVRELAYFSPTGIQETLKTSSAEINLKELAGILVGGPLIVDLEKSSHLLDTLLAPFRQAHCQTAALIPVGSDENLQAILVIGSRQKNSLSNTTVQPYAYLSELVSSTIDKISANIILERRLGELVAITTSSQAIATTNDASSLYATLHEQIKQIIGDYNLVVAVYDAKTNLIHIPYFFEEGEQQQPEPFPLGEGLSSIIIRTRQALLLVDDTEKRAQALGAKVLGKPAKSIIGVPLLIGGEAIGAILVQDTEREGQFDEEDLRFLTALASQVAGAIHNTQLLEETRQYALRLRTASEIARDISGSLDLDELLLRSVTLIRERYNYYHAAVFLIDSTGEYAVIREATGEAGAQLKRTSHKLGVGSKSIVGYVAGRGETLIVSDTTKDATYYANPLLPDTRSEAAIPMKIGERIVGVLDVQSTYPNAFGDEDLQSLQVLADQLAVAIINTELFAETQEHLSQHRLLHHITTSAASGTTLEEALNSAVQGLQVTLGGDRVMILLVDRDRKNLEVKSAIGYSDQDISAIRIPIGTGIAGWVAAHRQPLRVDNVAEDPRYIEVSSNTRSSMALPLIYRNEILGVLNVESEQPSAYNEHDEELLGTLGGSLAAIIANARLLEQIRRQAERERMLFDVTTKIRRSTDIQTILATTADELSKAVGARRAQIRLNPEAETDSTKKQ